jgi:type IV secretion system protein VirD4
MTKLSKRQTIYRELFLGHRRHLTGYDVVLTRDDQAHAMCVAPQRVGKTACFMVPGILASSRTVVATTSKATDLPYTIPHRLRLARATGGKVYLLNLKDEPTPELPAGVIPCRHDPLAGCQDPTWCQECAKTWVALYYAGGERGTDNSQFFQLSTIEVLGAYFHAAALARRDITQVVRWISAHAKDEPCRIIRQHGIAPEWATALENQVEPSRLQPGQVTVHGVFATAMTIVQSFTNPQISRQLTDPNFEVDSFLREGVSTLYVLDPTGDSKLSPITPIVTALVERIVKRAYRRASTAPRGRWEPGLGLFLDEMLNIAPLPSMRAHTLQGTSQSVVMAYAIHAVADLVARYGKEEARTILGNTSNHILFGRIGHGDRDYLEDLSALVGTYDDVEHSHSHDAGWTSNRKHTVSKRTVQRPILPIADFQRTPEGKAILVSHLTPWLLDMPRWDQVPWARKRGWDPLRTPLSEINEMLMRDDDAAV